MSFNSVEHFMAQVAARDPGEPERIVIFRVPWVDDRGQVQVNRGCVEHGQDGDYVNYVRGADGAGFTRVSEAMLDQGVV
ncbi:MAG: hypothetical protein HY319_13790 [Armatimonadetes bacterium]|nr:hypothetical protein [Armatimonadota bacterium]